MPCRIADQREQVSRNRNGEAGVISFRDKDIECSLRSSESHGRVGGHRDRRISAEAVHPNIWRSRHAVCALTGSGSRRKQNVGPACRPWGGARKRGHVERDTIGLFLAASEIVEAIPIPVMGSPESHRISTSHVERQNLTVRMHLRRFTRLTNAFSKKLTHMKAALSLHFAHYNSCRIHQSLRVTPAMAAGIADSVWGLNSLIL
jgi:hypothetical protein